MAQDSHPSLFVLLVFLMSLKWNTFLMTLLWGRVDFLVYGLEFSIGLRKKVTR